MTCQWPNGCPQQEIPGGPYCGFHQEEFEDKRKCKPRGPESPEHIANRIAKRDANRKQLKLMLQRKTPVEIPLCSSLNRKGEPCKHKGYFNGRCSSHKRLLC